MAALKLIGETGAIDARGVPITSTLLQWVLAVTPARDERSVVDEDCHFDRATFTGPTWFSEATFRADSWFGGATFGGDASFREVTFKRPAEFLRATFRNCHQGAGQAEQITRRGRHAMPN